MKKTVKKELNRLLPNTGIDTIHGKYSMRFELGGEDDRGCDVWSNSIETLRPLYRSLNSWILDYNRPEIDKMFKIKTI